MDQTTPLTSAMLVAVRNRNLGAFQAALQQGFDVRTYVRSTSDQSMIPFLEEIVRARFADALRIVIVDTFPCQVSKEDALRTFYSCLASCPSKSVIRTFVDSSLLGVLPILSIPDSYRIAMEFHCSKLSRRLIDVPGFEANCVINLFAGAWERPIHSAIKRNQYETSQRLLQLGAEVDATNCYGITALMMACGKVCVESVRLLLAHGADPNSAVSVMVNNWPLDATQTPSKRTVPGYPDFQSNRNRYHEAIAADNIIALLLCAGLRPSPGNWVQRTSVVVHMSRDAGLVLRKLVFRLPTLTELAVVQGRQQIRKMMNGKGGPGFNQILNNLHLPYMMKQQLAIELIS